MLPLSKPAESREPCVDALLVLLLGPYEFARCLGRSPRECGLEVEGLRRLGVSEDAVEVAAERGQILCISEPTARKEREGPPRGPCRVALTEAGACLAWRLASSLRGEAARGRRRWGRESGRKPAWDKKTGELRYDGETILQVRRRSSFQWMLLEAFQEAVWPVRVENPLRATRGDCLTRLYQTVKDLNRKQRPLRLRFTVEADGQSVRWEKER